MAFDPTTTRDLYATFAPAWKANHDFSELHEHLLRDGTYLREFGKGGKSQEIASQYQFRKDVSVALDLCEDLVDLRIGNIFRTSPTRKFDSSPMAAQIEAFLADVDGAGTSMDDFMHEALRAYYVNGVDIVVDKERPLVAPVTRADEANLRPFLHAFGPLSRLDWSCDHGGRYTFVRYDLGLAPRSSELDTLEQPHRFLSLDRAGWRLYSVSGEGDARSTSTEEGAYQTRVCPVVQLYQRRSSKPEHDAIPLSLMTRLTPIAKFLLNLTSEAQLDLHLTVAFLAICGITKEEAPTEMGASYLWAFQNPEAKVQRIVADVAHIVEKREWLGLGIQAMLRIGKLTGITADLQGRATSGVQVAVERGDLDSEMAATATQLEQAEQRIVQLAMSRMNPPSGGGLIPIEDLGYSAAYNRKYVLNSASDLIAQAKEFADIGVSDEVPGILRQLLRKVNDALGRKGDEDYDAAAEEIAEATFGNVQPAADAQGGQPAGGNLEGV